MIIVHKFKKEDFSQLDEHHEGEQVSAKEMATPEALAELESRKHVYSLKEDDQLLCICGLTQYAPDKAEGWMIMDKKARGRMIPISRKVKKLLKEVPIKTIEIVNDISFKPAEKLAGILGFHKTETTLIGRNGEKCSQYEQVKNDQNPRS